MSEKKYDSKIEEKDQRIKELNCLANTCYNICQDGNTSEFNNKLTELFDKYFSIMIEKYPHSKRNEEIIIEVFEYQLGYKKKDGKLKHTNGWNPKIPFYQASKHLLDKRINTSEPCNGPEIGEDEPVAPPVSPESYENIELIFFMINDAVQVMVKSAPNKFCYSTRFYTEFVSKMINEEHIPLKYIPLQTESSIDLDFADSFLEKKIDTMSDIKGAYLKSLFCFTNKEEDKNTPCGYDLHITVYQKYIESKGRNRPTASAISQQRTKFKEMLKKAVDKKHLI